MNSLIIAYDQLIELENFCVNHTPLPKTGPQMMNVIWSVCLIEVLKYVHTEKVSEVDNEKHRIEEFKLLHDFFECCPTTISLSPTSSLKRYFFIILFLHGGFTLLLCNFITHHLLHSIIRTVVQCKLMLLKVAVAHVKSLHHPLLGLCLPPTSLGGRSLDVQLHRELLDSWLSGLSSLLWIVLLG